MFFFDSLLYDLIGILTALIVGIYTFAKYRYTYWNRHGLYSLPAVVPFGHGMKSLTLQQSMGEDFEELYTEYRKKGLKHGGAFYMLRPFYIPTDLDIIKRIMQTDFQHFINHGAYVNEKDDPLSGHLFSLENERWKTVRAKLTPTFTSGKMKMMFNTLVDCSVGLEQMINDVSKTREALDIKEILQRFTIDIISSCAFGIETNTMKNPDSDFAVNGKAIFAPSLKNITRSLALFFINHDVLRFFKHKITDDDAAKFFLDVVKKTVDYREKNNVYRKDFMHLLLQLKNRGNVFDDEKITSDGGTQGLTMDELSAQAYIFFIAGYETSSTTMTFALYELAQRRDLQEKIREEINRVIEKHDGKLTYDGIMEMSYLDQVLSESLRKYPPVSVLFRMCNKDYKVSGTDFVLKKGIQAVISTAGIHHDPEYYPDPDKFDPDRFTEENKAKRPAYAWIPFGEGPRVCIGLRFGVMQAKVGLVTILRDYNVTLSKKTSIPLRISPRSTITQMADGGVWIHAEKI